MNLKPRGSEEPELSLVSMIDVVLMLLIFFILSTTFIHPGRIHVALPHASAKASAPVKAPITVTVTHNGSFIVNGRALINARGTTLRAALEKVAGTSRKQPVVVRADKRAATQSLVTVMDVAGSLGFKRINIITQRGGKGG
ncbi:MAG: ExbD/TolR family protein [Gammaproteobacteria bacterium]